jgi:S1-C subfamily serine protease
VGQPVPDLDRYMVIMAKQTAGVAIDIKIRRDGKEITLKVTPQ